MLKKLLHKCSVVLFTIAKDRYIHGWTDKQNVVIPICRDSRDLEAILEKKKYDYNLAEAHTVSLGDALTDFHRGKVSQGSICPEAIAQV